MRYPAPRMALVLPQVALLCLLAACATPLHTAIRGGKTDAVEALLAKGANINEIPRDKSPLMLASYLGNNGMVSLLLAHGADVNQKSPGDYGWCSGCTPLAWAAVNSHYDTARLLAGRGADLETARAAATQAGADTWVDREMGRAGVALLDRLAAELRRATSAPAGAGPPAARPAAVSEVDSASYRLPENPDDYAVVVGVERYSDLPDAAFAERDARAVARHLEALGVPPRNMAILLGEKASYKSIEKFVESWLPRNVDAKSRVFFYFSGHGAPDAGSRQAYLVPWDGDPGFLQNTGYSISRLFEKLGALKARQVLVALDACFSGAGGRSVLAKGARPLVTQLAAAPASPNVALLAAAGEDEITSVLDEQGHGAFTYYLLKGLSGGARDARGQVTLQGLAQYLEPRVRDAARRQNREQHPALRGGHNNEALFTFR